LTFNFHHIQLQFSFVKIPGSPELEDCCKECEFILHRINIA